MTINQFIFALIKIGIGLLICGGLARATYHYAVEVSHEEQLGLISLGRWSRQLQYSEAKKVAPKSSRVNRDKIP